MHTIRFSHKYEKMPEDINNTILLDVFVANDISERFRQYDTLIKDKNPFYKESYYLLPEGRIIVLLLKSWIEGSYGEGINILWTTVRRWTSEKEAYYRGIRGQQVRVEIKEE